MADSVLHELEPVMLSDQTEVKIPFVPVQLTGDENVQPGQPWETQQTSSAQNYDCPEVDDACDEIDTGSLEEVNRLVNTFRRFPTDMCIHQILHDYCSDENELDRIRALLFEALKVNDDFPYGQNCSLKRRVRTRNGDRITAKLAKDIHTLLSVMEGADFSELKDLLNLSAKSRSKSLSTQSKFDNNSCSCVCELKLLNDKISSLQADVLLTKQRQIAVEANRSTEIKTLKENITFLSDTLNTLSEEIKSHLVTMTKCLDTVTKNIESEISSKIMDTKSQLLSVNDSVLALQTIVQTCCEKSTSDICIEPATICEAGAGTASPPQPVAAPPLIKRALADQTQSCEMEQTATFGNVPIPVIVSDRSSESSACNKKKPVGSAETTSDRPKTYKEILVTEKVNQTPFSQSETGANKNDKRPNTIQVRVTRDFSPSRSVDSDFDLTAHVKRRKKTKRFYVGGFLPSVTDSEIKGYVTHRGQQVSKVTIFRNKRYNTATIRLNVIDDGDLSPLENPYYWPRGVTCRPWLSYNQYKRSRTRYDDHQDENDYGYENYRENAPRFNNERQQDFCTNNRFASLSSDVD